jgi:hypothetical protein
MLSLTLLVATSATSFAQGAGRGGRGGAGGAVGGVGVAGMGVPMTIAGAPRALAVLFVGTSVATDSVVLAEAVKIDAKYAAVIRAGRATRAGLPADSLVEKARIATAMRNDELKALLRNDDDRKKFDENIVSLTAGRGGA